MRLVSLSLHKFFQFSISHITVCIMLEIFDYLWSIDFAGLTGATCVVILFLSVTCQWIGFWIDKAK